MCVLFLKSHPKAAEIHSLMVRALSMVSAVVKVFDTTTTAIHQSNKKTIKKLKRPTFIKHGIEKFSSREQKLIKAENIPNVVSGFNPAMFRATSIGSTFARL